MCAPSGQEKTIQKGNMQSMKETEKPFPEGS